MLIHITDSRNLLEVADELSRGLEGILTAIGTEMAGFVQEDFETKSRGGAGAEGITWSPLAEATVKKRMRRTKDKTNTQMQIGVDTGLMRMSIQPGFSAGDSLGGNVLEVRGNEVEVGFGRKYAKYFDEGKPARASKSSGKKQRLTGLSEMRSDLSGEVRDKTPHKPDMKSSAPQPARKLIPDNIPEAWVEAAEAIAAEWVEDLFNKNIKG